MVGSALERLTDGLLLLRFRLVLLCRTFMMFGAMCLLLSTDPLALHSGQKNKEKVSATLINESEIIVKRLRYPFLSSHFFSVLCPLCGRTIVIIVAAFCQGFGSVVQVYYTVLMGCFMRVF